MLCIKFDPGMASSEASAWANVEFPEPLVPTMMKRMVGEFNVEPTYAVWLYRSVSSDLKELGRIL